MRKTTETKNGSLKKVPACEHKRNWQVTDPESVSEIQGEKIFGFP